MGGWHRQRERTNLCTTYLEDVSIATEAITTKMRGACTNSLTSPNCLASSLVEVRNRQLMASILHHPNTKLDTIYSHLSLLPSSPTPYPLPVQPLNSSAILPVFTKPTQQPCSPGPQSTGCGIIPQVETWGAALYGSKGNPDLQEPELLKAGGARPEECLGKAGTTGHESQGTARS